MIKLELTFLCLLDHAYEALLANIKINNMPMVARKAFNVREVWNPLCYHGNTSVRLVIMEQI